MFVLILRSYARLQESDWDLQRVLLKSFSNRAVPFRLILKYRRYHHAIDFN